MVADELNYNHKSSSDKQVIIDNLQHSRQLVPSRKHVSKIATLERHSILADLRAIMEH